MIGGIGSQGGLFRQAIPFVNVAGLSCWPPIVSCSAARAETPFYAQYYSVEYVGVVQCELIRAEARSGPWQVDSCSALVEDMEGRLSILHWMDHYVEPTDSSSAKSGDATPDMSDTESAVSQQAALLFDVLQLGNVPPELKGSPPKEAHAKK